jgi:hypothetical protein
MELTEASLLDLLPTVTVPEGARGRWRVERFRVTTEDCARAARSARLVFIGGRARFLWQATPADEPGIYTRLLRDGQVIMSDTPVERAAYQAVVAAARGHVHISGLGLGAVALACLLKPEVEHVTVVECSPDVLALVGAHYLDRFGESRLTLLQGDALTYAPSPTATYGAVWHDIWDDINPRNLSQMRALHARFEGRTDWQGSWSRGACERLVAAGWTPARDLTLGLADFPPEALAVLREQCAVL